MNRRSITKGRAVLAGLTFSVMLSGCATPLERGISALERGEYATARLAYEKALRKERRRAALPEWNGKEFAYRFNPATAAEAILGIADTYRAEGDREAALYYAFYYSLFCIRHDLEIDDKIEDIKSYVVEAEDEKK